MNYDMKRYRTILEFKDVPERQRFFNFAIYTPIKYDQVKALKVIVYPKNEAEHQYLYAFVFEKEVPTPAEIKVIEERVGSNFKLYHKSEVGIVRS